MTLADRILLYALYYIHKYYIREAYVVPFSWNTRNTELKKRLPNWIQLAKFFENTLKMCLDEKIWEKTFVINCSNSSIWTWIWRCSPQHLSIWPANEIKRLFQAFIQKMLPIETMIPHRERTVCQRTNCSALELWFKETVYISLI